MPLPNVYFSRFTRSQSNPRPEPMTSSEIRNRFLQYFERNGHVIRPSSSLVPQDDPTLMFSNAGMVQFKRVFTGEEQVPFSRATTAQRCLRVFGKHNDL